MISVRNKNDLKTEQKENSLYHPQRNLMFVRMNWIKWKTLGQIHSSGIICFVKRLRIWTQCVHNNEKLEKRNLMKNVFPSTTNGKRKLVTIVINFSYETLQPPTRRVGKTQLCMPIRSRNPFFCSSHSICASVAERERTSAELQYTDSVRSNTLQRNDQQIVIIIKYQQ